MVKKYSLLIALAVLVGLSVFPLLHPQDTRALTTDVGLAFALAICVTQLSALWFFLSNLKTFKKPLKRAYRVLAIGLFVFGLAQMQLPILVLTQVGNLGVVGILGPYLFGSIIMYMGLRRFAKLSSVHNLLTSFWATLALAVVVGYASSFLPHITFDDGTSEVAWDIIWAMVTISGVFLTASAALAWKIRSKVGQAYVVSMTWLVAALATLAFTCFHEVLVKDPGTLWDALTNTYVYYNLSVWPFLVASILFLGAGIRFKAVGQQYGQVPANASVLDIVMHTAGLASSPQTIDPVMEKVRALTARPSSSPKTTADEAALRDVYVQLESYLVDKEPLRHFNREELRAGLPAAFKQTLT